MPQPTVDQFKNILLSKPLDWIVETYIFEGTPYVFRSKPRLSEALHLHLKSNLHLEKENIVIVGSAKTGFSLNPDTFPRKFSDKSDIDVVVIDEKLFDEVWTTMLKWNYPRRGQLYGIDWEWAKKRREDLYWGWFMPDKISFGGLSLPSVLKPLRNISTNWFNAFKSLSRYPEFADRNISGRLYRTWRHALLYHVDGLRQIKEKI